MLKKFKTLALSGLGVFFSAAAYAQEASTPLTDMVGEVDLGDAQGAVVAAAGVIIGLVVLIYAIRKVIGLWGR